MLGSGGGMWDGGGMKRKFEWKPVFVCGDGESNLPIADGILSML